MLYIHGFDPAATERYRRMIARAGADRAGKPPVVTPVGELSAISDGWRVTHAQDGETVETVFEVLRYEDIIGQWRDRSMAERLLTAAAGYFAHFRHGGFRRVFAAAKRPALLSLYPVAVLLAFMIAGLILGGYFGAGLEALGAPGWTMPLSRVGGVVAGLWASQRLERRLFAHIMLTLYDFMFRLAADDAPSGRLEMRVELFARRLVECVARARENQVDEIMVVGHSLGALVAIKTLARALRHDADLTGGDARVSLLTLGSVAPHVAAQGGEGAEHFADEVATVAMDEDLTWVDVVSPRDWFCFGDADPALLMTDGRAGLRSPRRLSARFGRSAPHPDDPSPRFRAMGLHMKYLLSHDRNGGFDFFALASGPAPLSAIAERKRARA